MRGGGLESSLMESIESIGNTTTSMESEEVQSCHESKQAYRKCELLESALHMKRPRSIIRKYLYRETKEKNI